MNNSLQPWRKIEKKKLSPEHKRTNRTSRINHGRKEGRKEVKGREWTVRKDVYSDFSKYHYVSGRFVIIKRGMLLPQANGMKLTEISDALTVDDSDTNTTAGQKELGKTINQQLI